MVSPSATCGVPIPGGEDFPQKSRVGHEATKEGFNLALDGHPATDGRVAPLLLSVVTTFVGIFAFTVMKPAPASATSQESIEKTCRIHIAWIFRWASDLQLQ